MKKPFGLLSMLLLTACATNNTRDISSVGNELKPFTSDGCSSFPSGIPFIDDRAWLNCCIRHDIDYWKGGTSEERLSSDKQLKHCVEEAGYGWIAEAMYWGVRSGGSSDLPTSWRWGRGWKIDRPDEPFSPSEQAQIDVRMREIPADLNQIPIQSRPIFQDHDSVTGDYCVDTAVRLIERDLGRRFDIAAQEDAWGKRGDDHVRVLSLRPEGCVAPYRFLFELEKKNSCTKRQSLINVRKNVKLRKVERAEGCSVPKTAEDN